MLRTSPLLTAPLLALSSFLVLFIPCGKHQLNALVYPQQDRAHPARRSRKFIVAPAKLGVSAGLLSAVASGAHLTREI